MRAFLDQHGAWGPGRCRASFALSCRDLIEHAAIAEVRALYLRPAAKVGDGGELQWREARRMACGDLGIARPVAVARDDLLPFLAVQVPEVGHRHLARPPPPGPLVPHPYRRPGANSQ